MAFLSKSVSGARGRRRRSPGSDAPAEPFRAALRPRASGEVTVMSAEPCVAGLMLGAKLCGCANQSSATNSGLR